MKESNLKIIGLQDQISSTEMALERIRRAEQDYLDRISKLQSQLNEESTQRIALENSVRDLEYRHKRSTDQSREDQNKLISSYEAQISLLQSEIATLVVQVEGRREEIQRKTKTPQKNSTKKDPEENRIEAKKGKSPYTTGLNLF
jgi:chromosome segregation ATPase